MFPIRMAGSGMDRSDLALKYVDLNGRGLEIGPSYSPLVPKASGAFVEIVDHANRDELVVKYRSYGLGSELLARIEPVDYVWQGGSLLDIIPYRGTYDYIVGSNFIEHTVDLIGFLSDCEALLNQDGRLALVIPDKRYCFDRFQPLSTIGAVIDAHHGAEAFHPAGSLVDHQAYACKRSDERIAWGIDDLAPLSLQFPHLEGAIEALGVGLKRESYQDIHRWRFIPASFALLIHDLRTMGYHDLAILDSHGTLGYEFFATLGKGRPAEGIDRLAVLLKIEADLIATGAPEPRLPARVEHRQGKPMQPRAGKNAPGFLSTRVARESLRTVSELGRTLLRKDRQHRSRRVDH
jgi:hypothetical protein